MKLRILRWFRRGEEVWSEPALPPFVKVNPDADGQDDSLQPGHISTAKAAREFLAEEELTGC